MVMATRSPRLRWVPTAGWFAAFVLLTGCVALGVTDGLDLRMSAWARRWSPSVPYRWWRPRCRQ